MTLYDHYATEGSSGRSYRGPRLEVQQTNQRSRTLNPSHFIRTSSFYTPIISSNRNSVGYPYTDSSLSFSSSVVTSSNFSTTSSTSALSNTSMAPILPSGVNSTSNMDSKEQQIALLRVRIQELENKPSESNSSGTLTTWLVSSVKEVLKEFTNL